VSLTPWRKHWSAFQDASHHGIDTRLSAVLKTPEEAEAGSPLFLDMTEDARLLYDRDDFFAGRLERLRERLRQLGRNGSGEQYVVLGFKAGL